MIEGAVAQRYARALLSIAEDDQVVDPIGQDLKALADLIDKSKDLGNAFRNPMVTTDECGAVVNAIAEKGAFNKLTRTFLKLIVKKGRLQYISAISTAYQTLADQHTGKVRAEVRSTVPLMRQELDQIREALANRTGKEVIVETAIDPELLGGVVARVGDTIYDSSVRSHLARIRSNILAS